MTEPTKPLTSREWQVVGYMRRGWTGPRIARALGCKPRTVEAHVENIAAKLPNPDELTARALVLQFALQGNGAAA